MDVNPEGGVMLRSDFTLPRRDIGLLRFPFSFFPYPEAHVRYDLVAVACMI